MRFVYGLNDLRTLERAEENCYLLTNGLGGFSSLTLAGSNARNDQALLMGVSHCPNERVHLITNVQEVIRIGEKSYDLTSQRHVNYSNDQNGYRYLIGVTKEVCPQWTYLVEGVTIKKTILLGQGENTAGVLYEIHQPREEEVTLTVRPLYQGVRKGEQYLEREVVGFEYAKDRKQQISTDLGEWMITERVNGTIQETKGIVGDLYYEQDARDGRDAVGRAFYNHEISYTIEKGDSEKAIVFWADCEERRAGSQEEMVDAVSFLKRLKEREEGYVAELQKRAGLQSPYAKELVRSADQYIARRDSTNGKTILAGFPFFGDWGRDTMIAMMGCTITTKQFEHAKSILRTFANYCKDGLMPNIFPESGDDPLYNTVDAALLFFESLNQFVEASNEKEIIEEMYPVMSEILESYQEGTEYHIYMDEDHLICAGDGFEQVTWMDVRFEDILPTPRHGKPVEVNAYWYNAWKIYEKFSKYLGKEENAAYAKELAEKIKKSFLEKFWCEKGYLRDVVSGQSYDEQIRCNQVWALSLSYTMPNEKQAASILQMIEQELYTPYGLRSLSTRDAQFRANYGGSQFQRDMAYHQGTVWGYPLGAFYLAQIKYAQLQGNGAQKAQEVKERLEYLESSIREGCVGHIAEIFDGAHPTISKGCFAQAWSVGELLRVYAKVEEFE